MMNFLRNNGLFVNDEGEIQLENPSDPSAMKNDCSYIGSTGSGIKSMTNFVKSWEEFVNGDGNIELQNSYDLSEMRMEDQLMKKVK